MTAAQLNFVATVAFLLGLGAVTAVQVAAFARDIVFYQSNGWNFLLDSGNELLFLKKMRSSTLYRGTAIGLLRLQMGGFFLCLAAFILYALFHAVRQIGAI